MRERVAKRVQDMIQFIHNDYREDGYRFILEIVGMFCSIFASLVLAVTVPEPNIGWCYVLWMIGSACLVTASLSRGSTGFTIIYGTFLIIDSIGMMRWFDLF